ncbi:hypothetical protein, partial [Coxiella-like endosymbiont]|uniref:hypothetical protein n=1 Tax=Coxiella-like endosymbiont TaxID=1592897 RepID=UPI0019D48C06
PKTQQHYLNFNEKSVLKNVKKWLDNSILQEVAVELLRRYTLDRAFEKRSFTHCASKPKVELGQVLRGKPLIK